jgi:hypothetical protein
MGRMRSKISTAEAQRTQRSKAFSVILSECEGSLPVISLKDSSLTLRMTILLTKLCALCASAVKILNDQVRTHDQ